MIILGLWEEAGGPGGDPTQTQIPLPIKEKAHQGTLFILLSLAHRESFVKFTEMQFSSNFKSKINFTARNSSGISLLLLTVTHEHEIPRNKSQYHFL